MWWHMGGLFHGEDCNVKVGGLFAVTWGVVNGLDFNLEVDLVFVVIYGSCSMGWTLIWR